ncbi:MAG: acetolactate synthase small subunit [Deltaproteobacteria bacterium]|nr:acetolactate synthase small subunit [Deltaproteobacteria bacterium]
MANTKLSEHTVSVLVYNKPGVLSKVMSLITRRGFNVESVSAEKTSGDKTRIIVAVKADERSLEQIQKQLYKIVDVIKVTPIDPRHKVVRELAFVKVKNASGLPNASNMELFQLVDVFGGEIINATPSGFVFQLTGSRDKINSFISLIPENLIVEIARTGIVAINKWPSQDS